MELLVLHIWMMKGIYLSIYQSRLLIQIYEWNKHRNRNPDDEWWWWFTTTLLSVPITAQAVRFAWHVLWRRKRQVWDKSKHPMWVPPPFSSTFFLSSFFSLFLSPSSSSSSSHSHLKATFLGKKSSLPCVVSCELWFGFQHVGIREWVWCRKGIWEWTSHFNQAQSQDWGISAKRQLLVCCSMQCLV